MSTRLATSRIVSAAQCIDTYHRFFTGADLGQRAVLRGVLDDDVTFYSGSRGVAIRGADAVADHVLTVVAGFARMRHAISNCRVDVGPDAAWLTATVTCDHVTHDGVSADGPASNRVVTCTTHVEFRRAGDALRVRSHRADGVFALGPARRVELADHQPDEEPLGMTKPATITLDPLTAAVERSEITELVHRFMWAMDQKDDAALRVCLSDTTEFDSPRFGLVVGPDAIATVCDRALGHIRHTQHVLTNLVVTFESESLAHVDGYLHTHHLQPGTPGGDTYVIKATLADRVRKTPDGWRIDHHRARRVWMEGNPDVRLNPADASTAKPI